MLDAARKQNLEVTGCALNQNDYRAASAGQSPFHCGMTGCFDATFAATRVSARTPGPARMTTARILPAPAAERRATAPRHPVGCSEDGAGNVTQGCGRGSIDCFAVITGD
jgi:hypothetical protein